MRYTVWWQIWERKNILNYTCTFLLFILIGSRSQYGNVPYHLKAVILYKDTPHLLHKYFQNDVLYVWIHTFTCGHKFTDICLRVSVGIISHQRQDAVMVDKSTSLQPHGGNQQVCSELPHISNRHCRLQSLNPIFKTQIYSRIGHKNTKK